MMDLRYYQKEAIDAVLGEWAAGHRKTMACLPTGTGKTVIFASLLDHQMKQPDRRGLILAHRGELLNQAADKLEKATGLKSALEKAESSSLGAPERITVGSVQSMARPDRLSQFPPDYFTDIVIDECHHALSPTYQRVLAHFPGANVLGVSATPDRGDRRQLSEYFDSLAYEYSLRQAIHDKYLVPIRALMVPLKMDLRDVDMTSGDYSAGDLGFVLDPFLWRIAEKMKQYCEGRKVMVFLPLVSTSRKFCGYLKSVGFSACEVNGNSPDRRQILADFAANKYQVLCNAMLLTEGYDQPDVDCIVVLRPTKIRSLYMQMVGRGTRLAPGKKDLLLLDFLWMTGKHSLCHPSTLISASEDIAARMNARIATDTEEHDLLETEAIARRDVLAQRERHLAQVLALQRMQTRMTVDPLQFALSIESEDLASYTPTFAWEKQPASEKQLHLLGRYGFSPADIRNKGMASMLIDRLIQRRNEGLSSPKQIRYLESRGFRHVGTWPFEEANRMMSALRQHGWNIPPSVNPASYTPNTEPI